MTVMSGNDSFISCRDHATPTPTEMLTPIEASVDISQSPRTYTPRSMLETARTWTPRDGPRPDKLDISTHVPLAALQRSPRDRESWSSERLMQQVCAEDGCFQRRDSFLGDCLDEKSRKSLEIEYSMHASRRSIASDYSLMPTPLKGLKGISALDHTDVSPAPLAAETLDLTQPAERRPTQAVRRLASARDERGARVLDRSLTMPSTWSDRGADIECKLDTNPVLSQLSDRSMATSTYTSASLEEEQLARNVCEKARAVLKTHASPDIPPLDLSVTAKQHNEFAKMFEVLEDEARSRRQEITELRSENKRLQNELKKRPMLDEEMERLKLENATLRQTVDAAHTAQDKKLEAEVKHILDGEVGKLRLECERLQKQLDEAAALNTSHFRNWSNEENSRKEAEKELAKLTRILGAFFLDIHRVLTGCRSACVQLEAVAWEGIRKEPPLMFDTASKDIPGNLEVIMNTMQYVSAFLAKASAEDTRWMRKFRNLMC